ncbi:MAG: hypothetical protein KatS3mg039_1694 [Candidatus Kapaibacterium sp.]|nr:MAG: hypothetical protein KatS3mg039_1694 [Candidatus Kapabacteria bacterium]
MVRPCKTTSHLLQCHARARGRCTTARVPTTFPGIVGAGHAERLLAIAGIEHAACQRYGAFTTAAIASPASVHPTTASAIIAAV